MLKIFQTYFTTCHPEIKHRPLQSIKYIKFWSIKYLRALTLSFSLTGWKKRPSFHIKNDSHISLLCKNIHIWMIFPIKCLQINLPLKPNMLLTFWMLLFWSHRWFTVNPVKGESWGLSGRPTSCDFCWGFRDPHSSKEWIQEFNSMSGSCSVMWSWRGRDRCSCLCWDVPFLRRSATKSSAVNYKPRTRCDFTLKVDQVRERFTNGQKPQRIY